MLRGYLKILALKALAEGRTTGYGIVKYIEEKTGRKPSYGSIHPLLEQLIKCELVKYKQKDGKKICSLTIAGKDELNRLSTQNIEMINKLEESIRMFATIEENMDTDLMINALQMMKKGEINFNEVPAAIEMKQILMKLYVEKKLPKHSKEINKILKEASMKLKRLK